MNKNYIIKIKIKLIKRNMQDIINDKEKFNAIANNLFVQYDTNKNGVICEKELSNALTTFTAGSGAPIPDAETIKQVFLSLDKNNDGALSLEEFKEFLIKTVIGS